MEALWVESPRRMSLEGQDGDAKNRKGGWLVDEDEDLDLGTTVSTLGGGGGYDGEGFSGDLMASCDLADLGGSNPLREACPLSATDDLTNVINPTAVPTHAACRRASGSSKGVRFVGPKLLVDEQQVQSGEGPNARSPVGSWQGWKYTDLPGIQNDGEFPPLQSTTCTAEKKQVLSKTFAAALMGSALPTSLSAPAAAPRVAWGEGEKKIVIASNSYDAEEDEEQEEQGTPSDADRTTLRRTSSSAGTIIHELSPDIKAKLNNLTTFRQKSRVFDFALMDLICANDMEGSSLLSSIPRGGDGVPEALRDLAEAAGSRPNNAMPDRARSMSPLRRDSSFDKLDEKLAASSSGEIDTEVTTAHRRQRTALSARIEGELVQRLGSMRIGKIFVASAPLSKSVFLLTN
jgi:hypothetical protein